MAENDLLRFGIQLDIDTALQQLSQLRAKIDAVIDGTQASVAPTEAAAAADLEWEQNLRTTNAALDANRAALGSNTDATDKNKKAAADGGPELQRLAGAFTMVGGAVGQANPALGQAFSTVGQGVTQIASLSAAFGPLGIAIGVATTAFSLYERATAHATDATTEAADALDKYIQQAHRAAQAVDQLQRIQSGAGTGEDYAAELSRLQDQRAQAARRRFWFGPGLLGTSDAELADIDAHIHEVTQLSVRAAAQRESERQQRLDDERQANTDATAHLDEDIARGRRGGRGRGRGGGRGSLPDEDVLAGRKELAMADAAREAARAQIESEKSIFEAEQADNVARAAWEDDLAAKREANTEAQARADAELAETRERVLAKQAANEEQLEARRRQQMADLLGQMQQWGQSIGGVFNLIAESEGKSAKAQKEASIIRLVGQGTTEAIAGAIDLATAIGATVENPPLAVTKYISSGLHIANAVRAFAEAGQGGGAVAGAGGGGAGAGAPPTSRASPFDSSPANDNGGSTHTTIINVGTFPVSTDADVGRAVSRALDAHIRQDTAPDWLRRAG